MSSSATNALQHWQRLSSTRAGRWMFFRDVCFKAPYFRSIRPVFDVLEPGRATAHMKKGRGNESSGLIVLFYLWVQNR